VSRPSQVERAAVKENCPEQVKKNKQPGYLKNLPFVVIRDILVFDANDLFVGKQTAVLLWQKFLFGTFTACPYVFVPQLFIGETAQAISVVNIRKYCALTDLCLSRYTRNRQ
jgi:hypothetical protein